MVQNPEDVVGCLLQFDQVWRSGRWEETWLYKSACENKEEKEEEEMALWNVEQEKVLEESGGSGLSDRCVWADSQQS